MLSVTISKKMTVNTGNYSSIQPSVSMTLDEIKPDEFQKKVESLNILVDSLFTTNLMEHSEFMQLIKDNGLNVVLNAVNQNGMKKDMEEALEVLK
jgi:hypothetical protein